MGPEDDIPELTPREREIHSLLVLEGLTDSEMAVRLGMSERAVKFHVQNLLRKAQAPDRFKMAVAFWRAWSGYDEQADVAPKPVRRRGEVGDPPPPKKRAPKAKSAPPTGRPKKPASPRTPRPTREKR